MKYVFLFAGTSVPSNSSDRILLKQQHNLVPVPKSNVKPQKRVKHKHQSSMMSTTIDNYIVDVSKHDVIAPEYLFALFTLYAHQISVCALFRYCVFCSVSAALCAILYDILQTSDDLAQ
jgi:hypothetical protein